MTTPVGPADWLRQMFASKKVPLDVPRTIRMALALGVPLLVGELLRQPAWGLVIAVGGLISSMTEKPNPYPRRLTQILLVVPFGLAGFILTSQLPDQVVWQVLVFGLLGFAAGVVSSHGARFSVAAMMMLVFGSLGPHMAELKMTWQFVAGLPIGAAWTALLLCVEWAFKRHAPERALLAAYLEAVGRSALAAADTPAGQAVPGRQDVLAARSAAYGELLRLRRLSQGHAEYEEVTAGRLAAIGDLATAIVTESVVPDRPREALTRTGNWLLALGAAWRKGAPLPEPDVVDDTTLSDRAGRLGRALAGKPPGPPRGLAPIAVRPDWRQAFRDAVPGRAVIGAAGRLALCMAAAAAAMALVPGRSYWIPLTVAIVLKPDFGSVFARAILRTIGTLVGVLIGVAVLAVVPKGIWLIPVIVVFAAFMPWAAARNYALLAVFLTPFLVLLLDFATPGPTVDYGWQRLLDTAIGGVIVLVLGYLPWRSSRHTDVGGTFATAIREIVAYEQAAFHATPEEGRARLAAYRELSDLRTQLQRSMSEPPPASLRAAAWFPAVASAERTMDLVTAAVNHDAVPAPVGHASRLTRIAEAVAASPTMLPAGAEVSEQEAGPKPTDLSQWYGHELDVEIGRMERLLEPSGQ